MGLRNLALRSPAIPRPANETPSLTMTDHLDSPLHGQHLDSPTCDSPGIGEPDTCAIASITRAATTYS